MLKFPSEIIPFILVINLLLGCQSAPKSSPPGEKAPSPTSIGSESSASPPPPEVLTVQSSSDLEFSIQQYHAHRYHVAEYYLRKTLNESPDNPVALGLLPWSYFFQKKYDKAILAFANALSHFPKETKPLIGMGWSYVAMQAYEQALETFQRAEKRAGPTFQTQKGIAFCHLFLEQAEPANLVLSKIYTYHEVQGVLKQWDLWRDQLPDQLPEIAPTRPEALSLFTLKEERPRFPSILFSYPRHSHHPLIDQAWEWYRKKRYDKALRTFDSLSPEWRTTLDAQNGAAWSLFKTGKVLEAQKLFQYLYERYPGFPGVFEGVRAINKFFSHKARFAQYYFDIRKFKISENKFTELVETYPGWSHPRSMLGWVALKRDQKQEALNHFNQALSLNPEDEKAVQGLRQLEGLAVADLYKGDQALEHKQYKKASYHYFDYIDASPPSNRLTPPLAKAHSGLGFSQIGKGQYQMALKNFQKLAGYPKYHTEYSRGTGLALYHQEQFELATKYLITADALEPDHPDVVYPLDWSVLRSWDRPTAREYFEEKTRMKPNRASPYMALGWIHYKHGDPDLGVEYFLKAIALDPQIAHSEGFSGMLDFERFGWQVYNRLGWAHYSRGQYQTSLAMFEAALKRRPRSSEAMKGLGYTYYRQEHFAKAEEILKKCIKRNPHTHPVEERMKTREPGVEIRIHTSAATTLGRILYQQGRYGEALTPFLQELERHPEWGEVYDGLGWIYLQLNRLTESRDAFLQAIKHQPLNSFSHQGLREVKNRLALEKL